MARKWAISVAVILAISAATGVADPTVGVVPDHPVEIALAPRANPLLDSFPIPLPSYQVVPRPYDGSVLVAVEYLPELWMTPGGKGSLELCLDINPGGFCPVEARPLPKEDPLGVLGITLSDFFNQVAGITQVGFSVAYSFKP